MRKLFLTIIFFCFEFSVSAWLISKPIEIVLVIWRLDILFSFSLFSFREHGLNFGLGDSPRNALLCWITYHWDVENIQFPHISTYVLSYLSSKDWIISGVDLLQSSMDNVGCIYQNQEIMSFFVSTVKHLWSSNSDLI